MQHRNPKRAGYAATQTPGCVCMLLSGMLCVALLINSPRLKATLKSLHPVVEFLAFMVLWMLCLFTILALIGLIDWLGTKILSKRPRPK